MKKLLLLFILLIIPIDIFAIDIKSKGAILYNLNDDTILYELEANTKTPIASLTKIMTALVAIENIDNLDEEITMTSNMYVKLKEEHASTAGIKVGEKVTYLDLLYALMLPSGAEAAQGLAILIGDNIPNFVNKMNDKAKELNLKDTHFANPTGLDHKDNYSTPNDVAKLLKIALKNKTFKQIFTTKKYTTKNNKHTFYATSYSLSLKKKIDTSFIDGSKTGFTYDAGLCLASIAHHDNVEYLLVTINAPYNNRINHIVDHKNIYDYYFKNYSERLILKKNQLITKVSNMGEVFNYYSNKDIIVYLNNSCKIKTFYNGKRKISFYDKVGQKLGTYIIKCDDDIVYEKDILVEKNIHDKIVQKYIIISVVIVCIFVISLIIFIKMKRMMHFEFFK